MKTFYHKHKKKIRILGQWVLAIFCFIYLVASLQKELAAEAEKWFMNFGFYMAGFITCGTIMMIWDYIENTDL